MGITHGGARLNLEGSKNGNAMAMRSVTAIGQRFSPLGTGPSPITCSQ